MSRAAYDKIAEGLREALAYARGDTSKARVTRYLVTPEGVVKTIEERGVSERKFPVHPCHRSIVAEVDWNLLAPHERQARRNHDQSLERLSERGGLSLDEMAAIVEERPWRKMAVDEALAALGLRKP